MKNNVLIKSLQHLIDESTLQARQEVEAQAQGVAEREQHFSGVKNEAEIEREPKLALFGFVVVCAPVRIAVGGASC